MRLFPPQSQNLRKFRILHSTNSQQNHHKIRGTNFPIQRNNPNLLKRHMWKCKCMVNFLIDVSVGGGLKRSQFYRFRKVYIINLINKHTHTGKKFLRLTFYFIALKFIQPWIPTFKKPSNVKREWTVAVDLQK